MNAIMKLAAVALGAVSIAGGVAVAQNTTTDPNDGRADTANYGTPPGAPLKRDGSLGADPKATVPATSAATDTSSTTRTTTTSTTNWNNPPAAAPAAAEPLAATPADTSTDNTTTAYAKPRADRN